MQEDLGEIGINVLCFSGEFYLEEEEEFYMTESLEKSSNNKEK